MQEFRGDRAWGLFLRVRDGSVAFSTVGEPESFPRRLGLKSASVQLARPLGWGVRLAVGRNAGGVPGIGPPESRGPWQPTHPVAR